MTMNRSQALLHHVHKLPEKCFCRDLQLYGEEQLPVGSTWCVMGLLVGVTQMENDDDNDLVMKESHTANESMTAAPQQLPKTTTDEADANEDDHDNDATHHDSSSNARCLVLDDESGTPAILPLPAHMMSPQLVPGIVVECVVRRRIKANNKRNSNAASKHHKDDPQCQHSNKRAKITPPRPWTWLSIERMTIWPPHSSSNSDTHHRNDGMYEFQRHIRQILDKTNHQQQTPQSSHPTKQPLHAPLGKVQHHSSTMTTNLVFHMIDAAARDGGISLEDLALILHNKNTDNTAMTKDMIASTLQSLQGTGLITKTVDGLYRPADSSSSRV